MKTTIDKGHIDRAIAHELLRGGIDIGAITEEFLRKIMDHLLNDKEVYLQGFGRFKVSVRKGKFKNKVTLTQGTGRKGESRGKKTVTVKKKYYVSFKRADAFRRKFNSRFKKKVKRS